MAASSFSWIQRWVPFLYIIEIPAACYIVDTTQDSMAEAKVKDVYKDSVKDVAVHICTVAADLSLCAIWLSGEYCLEHFLVPRLPVDNPVVKTALWIFRIFFAISTLVPCASKIRKHVLIMWMRDSAAIRNVKEEVRALDAARTQATLAGARIPEKM